MFLIKKKAENGTLRMIENEIFLNLWRKLSWLTRLSEVDRFNNLNQKIVQFCYLQGGLVHLIGFTRSVDGKMNSLEM